MRRAITVTIISIGGVMEQVLTGKVAIVTGAGGRAHGIGAAYAHALSGAGARVVVADINGAGAADVANQIEAEGGSAIALTVDITDDDSVAAMALAAKEAFGRVDILVNNAALMAELSHGATLIDYPMDEWHRVLDVNLTGALRCCRSVVPIMRENGGGKIINQSSGGAFVPSSPYAISKLAIVGLTSALARQLGPDGINVNAIAPGLVESEAGLSLVPADSPARDRFTAFLRQAGKPKDLCGALLLLASPAGDWITGQTINVDGGWIVRV